eukprot:GFKZ01013210.1.p1 GENE.GFKZ01013210.1~~GFKZ01013210.1.p1  ORF type:complete len:476 (-),score=41.49 GFKZ01013210.1:1427-2692(-)
MSRRQVSPPLPAQQHTASPSNAGHNQAHPRKVALVPHISSSHLLPLIAIAVYLFASIYFAWSQTPPLATTSFADTSSSSLNMFQTAKTRPANIAYFIRVSKRSIYHLPRLLRQIYHSNNSYALHFDTDLDPVYVTHAIKNIRTDPNFDPNIFFLPTDIITPHGVSVLLNTIAAINLLMEKGRSWDYFINLDATDYPLVPVQTQRQLLGLYPSLNFFNLMPGRSWHSVAKEGLSRVWYDESLAFHKKPVTGSLQKLNAHNPLIDDFNLKVCSADISMILSREFCQYILEADTPRKFLIGMSYGMDSAHQFFATLAWNHETFISSIVPYSVRLSVGNDSVASGDGDGPLLDAEDGDGRVKSWEIMKESHSFFAGRFGKPDSSVMQRVDRRANNNEAISNIAKTFLRTIVSRESRRLEAENRAR